MDLNIFTILKTIPAALIGLTIHEYSHALMSYKLGDTTAKDMGRLTLNPLKHIDPVGLLLIIIAGFGWAKPVQFNPENLKNKHRDEILISLAGPVSNLLLGILFIALARILFVFMQQSQNVLFLQIINLLMIWSIINFGLFVFNLIPIPPLDGSHVYMTFIKEISMNLMTKMYKYGTVILLIIILAENRMNIDILPITPVISAIYKTCVSVMGFN